jgi:DNA-binding transcriptional ArsR family regulator/uncharacterized protein YndB with AHSA1/START domain
MSRADARQSVFAALSDPTRRRILDMLRARPRTTGQISAQFPQSRYAIMKHLGVLEESGLVSVRRKGRERWNYINATPLRRIYERWLTPYQQLWANNLSRLGTIVEGEARSTMSERTENAVRQASIEQVTEIAGAPAAVFDALTSRVANWWSHVTYESATRPDLKIEPHVGGRFVETSGDSERLYAIITRYEPGKRLWMEGAMGLGGCIFGTITFELEPRGENATEVRLSHRMIGEVDDEVAAMYRGGWKALLDENLKQYVENGTEAWSAA